MTKLELKEKIEELNNRAKEIIDSAKGETRDLNEDENTELADIRSQVTEYKTQITAIDEAEQRKAKELNTDNKNSNIFDNKKMTKKLSLVKEIRNAIDNNERSIVVNAETRATTVQGQNGVHDSVVETEIEGILEPLYANSVLTQLGARWYTGLPMGDVQIPIMSASTVKWEGEIDDADATDNTFTTVKLSPKRLSAYIDISKQLIAQDTIGVETAIRRDLVNALNAKLEATLFGDDAATTEQPAGLFNGKTPTEVTDFKGVCDLEAEVESNNIYGEMKYVMNPKAKAGFRSMIKGTNNSGFVYEAGEMDGIPTYVTTNVDDNLFIYGDFSNLLVGSWGNIELTIDPFTQATKGCVRLIVNAYFDFKPARNIAFAFGEYSEE